MKENWNYMVGVAVCIRNESSLMSVYFGGKTENTATIYWNVQEKGKNKIFTILSSLKVSIYYH